MKRLFILGIGLTLGMNVALYANTLLIGAGQTYTTIQSAINAASAGDTIKVLPGTYNEAIAINKNLVIQGSGYETTRITSTNDPTVTMGAGKLMWFALTSTSGNGAQLTGGIITNCIIAGCGRYGVLFVSGGSIKNSVIIGNASDGANGWNNNTASYNGTAVNCISRGNGGYGFQYMQGVTYSDGSMGSGTNSNMINSDPAFVSGSDFHISPTSPCYQTGNPADVNPDGSRSDMGYFGGSDCPIYPVVTKIVITPAGNGQVQIQATAQANY